jgi:hypothetical protein
LVDACRSTGWGWCVLSCGLVEARADSGCGQERGDDYVLEPIFQMSDFLHVFFLEFTRSFLFISDVPLISPKKVPRRKTSHPIALPSCISTPLILTTLLSDWTSPCPPDRRLSTALNLLSLIQGVHEKQRRLKNIFFGNSLCGHPVGRAFCG